MARRSAWHRLPDVLVEKIFAYLPISSVFLCRCVCKKWKSILTSGSFLDLWAEFSPRNVLFLVYHTANEVASYSPRSGRWHNVPLYERCSLSPDLVFLASSGGLICFRSRNTDNPTLIVCNPVSNSHRVLPEMLQIRHIVIVGMLADPVSGSYQILVTGTPLPAADESFTELYDSRAGMWFHHCCSCQDFLQVYYEEQAFWLDGSFYCLINPLKSLPEYRLISYDLEKRDWFDLNVELPSGVIRCMCLMVCQGKLLLAGTIVEDYTVRSICIWMLRESGGEWSLVKVEEMPDEMLRKMDAPCPVFIQCQGHGDLICFSTLRGWQSIIYNFYERTWEWMPENEQCKRGQMLESERNTPVGMPYEPSLSARV